MRWPPLTVVGVAGVTAGCAGMVAMLPGAIAGAPWAIGLTGSSALARSLSPVGEPLFVASTVLLILDWPAAGSSPLSPSMFQLAAGDASPDGGDSMSMQQTHDADRGNTPRRRSTSVSR